MVDAVGLVILGIVFCSFLGVISPVVLHLMAFRGVLGDFASTLCKTSRRFRWSRGFLKVTRVFWD